MSKTIPTITLNNHTEMPLCGLGVYKATGENEVETAIAHALHAGYRLIDTASAYKNEDGVGRAIKASPVPREELFITTKIWNTAPVSYTHLDVYKRQVIRGAALTVSIDYF